MKSETFFKFKNKNWFFSICYAMAAVMCCLLVFVAYNKISSYALEKNGKPISRVIIDAGHGA